MRPFFGFLALNIFYFVYFIKNINIKFSLIFLVILLLIIFSSNYFVIPIFYKNKINNQQDYLLADLQALTNEVNYIRNKESLIIGGIDSKLTREMIIYNNKNDKFIRFNQFMLTNSEMQELIKKIKIDLWLVNPDSNFITENLNVWPFIKSIKTSNETWQIYINEDYINKINRFYIGDRDKFSKEWKVYNNCQFRIENNALVLYAPFNDPYFENINLFDFKKDLKYYFEVEFESPSDSYFQFFYKSIDTNYSETNSIKINTQKGFNRIFIKIPHDDGVNKIRVDLGTNSGKYIIRRFNIYEEAY